MSFFKYDEPDKAFRAAEQAIDAAERDGATSLDLSDYGLTALPERIGDLTALQELNVSNNKLTALPERIGDLTALQGLFVIGNKLTALPERIGDLTALQGLFVISNKLTALPERIGDLTALQQLNVGYNKLTALPGRIGDLTALQELNVWGNKLTALPGRIGDLTALQQLDVGYNKLTALPERIGDLTALQKLDVSANQLTALPERIGDLTALQKLDVSANQLTALPERIGDLTTLQELRTQQNKLKRLQVSLSALPQGCSIALFGNQLQDPPQALAISTRARLDRYLTLRERVENNEPVTVWSSGLASIALDIPSRLAVLETVIAVVVALALAITGQTATLWSAAVFAPFLLTRTNDSRELGLDRYARACRILDIRTGRGDHWLPLPFRLLALGPASIGIKFWTAAGNLWRQPFMALSAIPANYRFFLSRTDALSPPELVPGAASGITPADEPVLAASDLRHDFRRASGESAEEHVLGRAARNIPVSLLGYLTLGIFLVFAWAYRWSIKASVVIYWPFLLFTPAKITAADVVDGSSAKKKPILDRVALISFQTLLLAQSAYFLLRRGAPEVAAPLLSRLPGTLQGWVSDLAGIVESFPPSLSLTWLQLAIFSQAVLFFARGVPRFYLAHYGTNPPDGIDRFLLNTVMTCRMLQNLALAAASLYFFLWGVVWAPSVAEAVITFFARLATGA